MPSEAASYALAEERLVRAALSQSTLHFRLLKPPFPAYGVGALRVLRVREIDGTVELVAGYDRYERHSS